MAEQGTEAVAEVVASSQLVLVVLSGQGMSATQLLATNWLAQAVRETTATITYRAKVEKHKRRQKTETSNTYHRDMRNGPCPRHPWGQRRTKDLI